MDDWLNIAYLRKGTERQQEAYEALLEADIFPVLAAYDPVLVGTIPLDIDLPTSNLDILACAHDLTGLEHEMQAFYGDMPDFATSHETVDDHPTLICSFLQGAFTIQLFAQPIPVEEQAAFRHMVVQSRLLRLSSDDTRPSIRALKQEGLNTEEAFCRYFLIPGEPRAALLELYDASHAELEERVLYAAHHRNPHAIPEYQP